MNPAPPSQLSLTDCLACLALLLVLGLAMTLLRTWWGRPEQAGLREFLTFMLLPFFLYAVVWAFRRVSRRV